MTEAPTTPGGEFSRAIPLIFLQGSRRVRFLIGGLAVFSSLMLALPASAATVQVTSGNVFIDRGEGYASVSGATSAKSGDMVMAMAGGRGEIVYDDGCRQAVEVGSVVVVSEISPCAAGPSEAAVDNVYLYTGLVVVGVIGGVVALTNDDDDGDKCITKCKK